MTTYVFPGQGSQFKGMGQNLFSEFPELVVKANEILGYSIEDLCLEDPLTQLTQTQFTQPALYIVNALTYFNKVQETGKIPNFVAGHSLGEYNALLAAGAFDFETGLTLVKKRGELMSQAKDGSMMAIIGLKADHINTILTQYDLKDVKIANNNSYTQLVVAGSKESIQSMHSVFEEAGAMIIPLKVSGAFHSSYMKPAQDEFELFLKEFQFFPPKIPVIANYTAIPYTSIDTHNNLIQQITHPVRWTESISYILEQGETEFEEVGPGKVLTGLVQRIMNGK